MSRQTNTFYVSPDDRKWFSCGYFRSPGLLLALMLFTTTLFAGPTVVRTDNGYYVMTVGSDGTPKMEKADFLDKRTGSPPTDPTIPPVGQSEARRLSESLAREVNNKDESVLLGAVYALFARKTASGAMDLQKARNNIADMRRFALVSNEGGTVRWEAWSKAIDAEMSNVLLTDTSKYFSDVRDGLAAAAGVAPGDLDAASDPERTKAAIKEGGTALPAGFNWQAILEIIQMIIEWLIKFGIL